MILHHRGEPPDSAVLAQRSGRSPYTPRSNVATQRQGCHRGNSLRCVAFHSFTHALQFSRFLVRYPRGNDSKRVDKLGLQKAGSLSAATVPNLFQNSYDFIQPFVDVVQGPSNPHEGGNEHPEVPGGHRSTLPKLGLAYARPLFLAGSHFTGRTPHPSKRSALLRCGWSIP